MVCLKAKYIAIILLLLVTIQGILCFLLTGSRILTVFSKDLSSWEFRNQECTLDLLRDLLDHEKEERVLLLTISMLTQSYQPDHLVEKNSLGTLYKPEAFEALKKGYDAIWGDVECFPVTGTKVYFENTWLADRSYGGARLHEGCDIFGEENVSGYYPIVSMTDGTVEKIGWLPLGGYRIGIRGPKGGYFYYAHLDSYDRKFQEGDRVRAGEILGLMGNSGYGCEGTVGQFPVHLHLGIYISWEEDPEISVNPYWILRYAAMESGLFS